MIDQPPPHTVIGAHRGASGEAPENTFAAFDLALQQGSELLEFDVHCSADGTLVVIHDASLNRTAGRDGQVGEMSATALQACDVGRWRGAAWAGQTIPTLAEVLDRYAARVLLNIEVKLDGAERPYPGVERLIVEAVAGRDLFERATISSFDAPSVERLRRREPQLALGVIDDAGPDEAIDRAAALGGVAVHLEAGLITEARLRRAHRAGLRMLAWTVDDAMEMVRLVDLGVDTILSNYPARLRDVVLARRQEGRAVGGTGTCPGYAGGGVGPKPDAPVEDE